MSVGSPAIFYLNKFGIIVADAFDGETAYHVGSSVRSKKFRDVDVRILLDDDKFKEMFGSNPHAGQTNKKLSAYCMAFSALGEKMTGLNIDFQIQQRSDANKRFPTGRSALIEVEPDTGREGTI